MNPEKKVIVTSTIETPVGSMIAGATGDGICLLEYVEDNRPERGYEDLARLLNADITEGENEHSKVLQRELTEYFNGERKAFDVPLVITGTPFQEMVWKELLNIPYGTTRSYMEQSIALKKPDAIRAIAAANGSNRIAILVPCHRVIGANGSLTGYGGGLWRKKWLLDLEKGQLTLPTLK